MVTCEYCSEPVITIHNDEPLCEKHFQHFQPTKKIDIIGKQVMSVPKIKCEVVYNRKYTNLMVDFTTYEEYQSILKNFKRDVRIVRRKNELYKKIE